MSIIIETGRRIWNLTFGKVFGISWYYKRDGRIMREFFLWG